MNGYDDKNIEGVVDLKEWNYIPFIDEKLQYALSSVSINSNRHRIKNNLPGTVEFLSTNITRLNKLENYIRRRSISGKTDLNNKRYT